MRANSTRMSLLGGLNEEQIIIGYPIDGAMGSTRGEQVRKLSVVCCERHPGFYSVLQRHPNPASAPSMLLVLLEPH